MTPAAKTTSTPVAARAKSLSAIKKRVVEVSDSSESDVSDSNSKHPRKRPAVEKPVPSVTPVAPSGEQSIAQRARAAATPKQTPASPRRPPATASPHPSPKKQATKPGSKQQNLMGMFAKIACMLHKRLSYHPYGHHAAIGTTPREPIKLDSDNEKDEFDFGS